MYNYDNTKLHHMRAANTNEVGTYHVDPENFTIKKVMRRNRYWLLKLKIRKNIAKL